MTSTADILVAGASGHFGRATLTHLIETLNVPASRIVATTRQPESLSDWAVRGVTVRAADYDEPASLSAAFEGVKRLLLISTDALDEPGKRLRQHKAAVEAAAAAGIQHIVYTSLPQAETSLVSFAPDHAGTEQAIAASTIPGHTFLRNGWYAENILHSLPHALESGTWYTAAGEGRTSYLRREDLALAAAVAVSSDFEGQRIVSLYGPKAYSAEDIADLARKATGKPLNVVQVPIEGLIQGMVGAGVPEPVATIFASFDAAIAAGNLEGKPDEFKALTGRDPVSFEDWFATDGVKALTA